ncbi:MAG: bifunctional oligoribonuclease/PAP phosphatase NrnA [Ruminococcaceae bacterium]|nr:bifunctional oligoribonuclease/PAP phosphatase NrnA [Oscillospiraceae bacterium]
MVKEKILKKIEEYDRIIIFRHFHPDCDAVGASLGLREILRLSYPEKEVLAINHDFGDETAFLGDEDGDIDGALYSDALGILIDTATLERASNKKFSLCRELIKIDHHINVAPYGDISWVEPNFSSACEMIASFYQDFSDRLKINKAAATYLYCGMVTDSGRFRFNTVSGDTLRLAAMLLDLGVDTDKLFSDLYLTEYSALKFQSYVYKKMKTTESGVLYIYIDRKTQKKFGLSREEAGNAVMYMESVKNCLIWIAFIECDDGKTRARLRSRFVKINKLAEKYSGGGHACASGATVSGKKQAKELVRDADALLKDYKASNEGWQ